MEATSTPRFVRALRAIHEQKRGRTELEGAEAGFTLIELMVVLLIMAILLAIAIPTFLGVKAGAQDRAIQSDLTNALTSAKAAYANSGSYGTTPALETASLASAEPNLIFDLNTVQPTKGTNALSVGTSADGQQLVMVGYSASNGCWAVEDNEGTASGDAITNTVTYTTLGVYYAAWLQSAGNCGVSTIPAAASLAGGAWTQAGFPPAA
jgi:type IV pilus assembly protein PilA